ncbi:hypothetical protein PHYBLDRAFT_168344 [Phycomyces blakesleeanus NRRL 1555(-)]|uniref:Uncharacterized protein n=1 Tax=Phycomyces blakesleeanus (strain ATCC 8743b / DSM 1359 / FGSC 10004 / NBRC 33097 / NRRL 1555) TaxID=763407 RepID=A0A167MTI0_PHYB8|nr:hypothetical protein PHYBLDRAFT_168344 [Phycomyces blakesleeanus NRRL 1555(-)]OAD73919.1 hypothetical protein PHYBLDRAFT_168344 [Phycomyces blakesleeanus NRRL 1555(-)]|eukprot:XP_018291959.1 hypothetical protein PHYBLDRAFT_168344 [Phycomyces blakesleeanus NRRL 1555(-)]
MPYQKNLDPLDRCIIKSLIDHCKCTGLNCLENMASLHFEYRLWNRDLVAVLNPRHIINQLRCSPVFTKLEALSLDFLNNIIIITALRGANGRKTSEYKPNLKAIIKPSQNKRACKISY